MKNQGLRLFSCVKKVVGKEKKAEENGKLHQRLHQRGEKSYISGRYKEGSNTKKDEKNFGKWKSPL